MGHTGQPDLHATFLGTGFRAIPDLEDAAFGLFQKHARASAGRPLWPPWALVLGPGSYSAGLLAYAPTLSVGLLIASCVLSVIGLTLVRLIAAATPVRYSTRKTLPDTELPVMSVIVALHDEAAVIPHLMKALSGLNYPRTRLDVVFALEAHDYETRQAIHAARHVSPLRVRCVVLPQLGPTTKPRALNVALQATHGDLIAVYDAEDLPAPDQLRAAAEAFAEDPDLGVVQAPLGWFNRGENWLTQQFGLEYAAQFHALLPLYHRWGWPLPLGGTSNVFRRHALNAVHGWDPFNVTEDADLGFRLARHGWRAGLIEPGTLEEAPITARAWIHQRSRWLKGHFVTWLVHMRDPVDFIRTAGWRGWLSLHLTVFANMASAIIHAPTVALSLITATGLLWMGRPNAALVSLSVMAPAYMAAMACAAVGARRAGLPIRLPTLLTMPFYWLMQAPAAAKALKELPRQPYVWSKTQHGVSRCSRTTAHDTDHHRADDGRHRRPLRLFRLAQQPPRRSAQAAPGALADDRVV